MAKIIGIDESKAKRITCYDCGAIVEYFPNEVISRVEEEVYGGGSDVYHYLTCPNCKKLMKWC